MTDTPPALPVVLKKPDAAWVKPIVRGSIWLSACVIIAFVLLVYFRLTLGYGYYKVPTNGMAPTLIKGDQVVGLARNTRLEQLHQGDIVIFHMIDAGMRPEMAGATFIQRLAALPGQHVQLQADKVLVNGSEFTVKTESGELHYAGDEGSLQKDFIVPPGKVLTLGDNTHNSFDGRYWGFLPADRIFQTGVYRVAPLSRAGTLR